MGFEFNKELDEYLEKRRSFVEEDEIVVRTIKPRKKAKIEVVEEERTPDDVEDVEQEKVIRKPWWVRLKESLFGTKQYYVVEKESLLSDEVEEEPLKVPDDIVEIIKIQHRWLLKLSPQKLMEFRNSEDFKRYKEVLEKYGIARSKK